VGVEVRDESKGASVLADRAGVEQIVTNVVSNAIQASSRGGLVSVVTRCLRDDCELVVEDAGTGIPAEVLSRIFDPFFTTKQTGEGTGLGLSVTLGIVEQFGGRITVSPRSDGIGTVFVVVLPRIFPETLVDTDAAGEVAQVGRRSGVTIDEKSIGARPPARSPITTVATAASPPHVRLVLIIDDEPTIRAALRRYFVRRGWEVEEAADGKAGLARIDDLGDRVALVVSDLRMPGFSGIDLHDRLAVTRPALLRRFVFSTGDVASGEAASFVQRTHCPVLQKPFELRMLDEIIASVVEGAAVERVVT
jgi:CheY-like chemotaxis protein/anti-sigma regulatory factor (Ser/Thr protein kinase)